MNLKKFWTVFLLGLVTPLPVFSKIRMYSVIDRLDANVGAACEKSFQDLTIFLRNAAGNHYPNDLQFYFW